MRRAMVVDHLRYILYTVLVLYILYTVCAVLYYNVERIMTRDKRTDSNLSHTMFCRRTKSAIVLIAVGGRHDELL